MQLNVKNVKREKSRQERMFLFHLRRADWSCICYVEANMPFFNGTSDGNAQVIECTVCSTLWCWALLCWNGTQPPLECLNPAACLNSRQMHDKLVGQFSMFPFVSSALCMTIVVEFQWTNIHEKKKHISDCEVTNDFIMNRTFCSKCIASNDICSQYRNCVFFPSLRFVLSFV